MKSELIAHVQKFFGERHVKRTMWPRPPAEVRLPGLEVLEVSPNKRTPLWTYISVGAWPIKREHHALEFFVMTNESNESHVELVSVVAHYHAEKPDGLLGIGHTLPIGRAWLPGSSCTSLLISTPYNFPEELTYFQLGDEHVQLAWVLPITEEERTFGQTQGLDPLEERFEKVGLEYWNPARKSVV